MPLRNLVDLTAWTTLPVPWKDFKPNLPWGDQDFSKRMLKEHLDPTHDNASRRPDVMKAQIDWLETEWFKNWKVEKILDLTCGPGLISNELARRGYTVRGIDISPAAIDYARKTASLEGLKATYLQGDIREVSYGGNYDAVIFNYGMPSSFEWEVFSIIMLRTMEALNPTGLLILEFGALEAMQRRIGKTWKTYKEGGLFGDHPYLDLIEYVYNPDDKTSCRIHHVVDPATARVREYCTCYQGYTSQDLESLLPACGLRVIAQFDSLTGDNNLHEKEWLVIVAERPES